MSDLGPVLGSLGAVFFCSAGCAVAFGAEPERYAAITRTADGYLTDPEHSGGAQLEPREY
jgi:hypothetical protein